jgi:[acyl-carrier-protein] S-malonyltransferase
MAEGLLDLPVSLAMLEAARDEGLDLAAQVGGDAEALRATEIAQPALLLVEVALSSLLDPAIPVVGVAGHSVGEYAALVAAGAIGAADAMRLVVARGREMAAMRQGTMAALLGADAELAEAVCAEVRETGETVGVANLNGPGQVVISGTQAGVDAALARARERGVRRAMPLRVGGAFHSPLMAQAAERFAARLDAAPLVDPGIPVVCNVDGAAVGDAAGLRDRLRRQLSSAVRWTDCLSSLVDLGAEALVEFGPGETLTGIARRAAPGVAALAVSTPDAAAHLGERLTSNDRLPGAAISG